jgi:DNA-binding transcriptional MerR regulator
MAKTSKKNNMTIGGAIKKLAPEFPSLSISKIRYLEEEGLLKPKRTPGGYRKFFLDDIERLRIILRLQKEEYLPLNVIKERLDKMDRGEEVDLEPKVKPLDTEDILAAEVDTSYFSIEETAKKTGLTAEELKDLESFGLLELRETEEGKGFDSQDLELITIVHKMAKYGIEPRHLRIYKHFADREAAFFEQILMPMVKQNRPDASGRSTEILSELINLSDALKRLLLSKVIHKYFQNL